MNRFTNAEEILKIWKKIGIVHKFEIYEDGTIRLIAKIVDVKLAFKGDINNMGDLESEINDAVRKQKAFLERIREKDKLAMEIKEMENRQFRAIKSLIGG